MSALPDVVVPDAPGDGDRAAILALLSDFNRDSGFPSDMHPVCVLLKDADGTTVGGLWGKTVYDWMFVEFLVVPEELRGHDLGTKLMDEAERLASERGCVGAWLTTFTYQARPFYARRGYDVFGELPNSPRDNVRIFMRKWLGEAAAKPWAADSAV
ncbi:GNAT family N-acetyltransferase [Sphingomonas sabuli]|uniref:GNAT family N-acetyltransferase n=1 Tax=Sphingomonas sabuli TaxID=2764186 RepID=A0A7G9L4G4_9SPHN|nr:GNAT family N-acetyltransferase [Sphingomonas sabuli]QNM83513.1 GNAT family N-acetyltransferase [Sphingomonas sabuli]